MWKIWQRLQSERVLVAEARSGLSMANYHLKHIELKLLSIDVQNLLIIKRLFVIEADINNSRGALQLKKNTHITICRLFITQDCSCITINFSVEKSFVFLINWLVIQPTTFKLTPCKATQDTAAFAQMIMLVIILRSNSTMKVILTTLWFHVK